MSVGFRNAKGSGFIDPLALKDAEEVMLNGIDLDHDHDVPFVAGVSEDGKTVYVDKSIDLNAGGVDRTKPLLVHELVEHCLMRMLGMPYEAAHAIATAAEEACIRADGISQTKYDKLWDADIRKVASRGSYKNVPDDIDTEPYQQDGNEEEKKDVGLLG